jgi:hypothetical protein
MAAPINTFKSYSVDVTTDPEDFYTTPIDATTIVLLAQAANVGNSDADITFYTSLNNGTEIVKDFSIPVADAAGLLSGKLVLEPGTAMGVYASANSAIKFTVSILETR